MPKANHDLIGTERYIMMYEDGSSWAARVHYGKGIVVATYVAGRLHVNAIKNMNGQDSVRKSLCNEVERWAKCKIEELSADWHSKHNELYELN